MKLRIFLPALDRADAATSLPWMLFDARGMLVREEASDCAGLPKADAAEIVVPASRVLFARLKLPRVSTATLRELLPYAVEDRLLADPSRIHAVAGATDARGETVVAVIDRDWLQAMLDLLARCGVRPAKAWCESALLAGGRGDWHLVLGAAFGMLVDDDGVSVTFDRTPGAGFPLALRIALDEAGARGDRPQSIRVHSEGGAARPDLERWSAEAGVRLEAGTTWEAIARDTPADGAIDLLAGDFAARWRGGSAWRIPRMALALAATIALVQLGFVAAQAWRLGGERAQLEARREAIFRAAFPEARVVVDPDLQMARNLAELRRSRGLLAGDDFMVRLTRAAREPAIGRVRSIDYRNGRLDIRRGDAIAEAAR